jgi:hypothetical protein
MLATRVPRAFRGAVLHRWGLMAAHRGAHAQADRLFERAAERYRAELAVEPLARLRVHQRIVAALALDGSERDGERCLEIERMLTRLDRIERLEPPFDLVEAHTLLATWRQLGSRPDARPAAEDAGTRIAA